MAKADRILGFFPGFVRAKDANKLLRSVVTALADPIEEVDSLLFRIQRAHRMNVAEDAGDIVKLAGILNLDAAHFEDLFADDSIPYTEKLSQMRDRARRIARVHLGGLGTPQAILEAAAIFLNATIVAAHPGDPPIKHIDSDGYSHKAMLEFRGIAEKPREPIYLYEAPQRRQKVDPTERWTMDAWPVSNHSPDPAPVRLVIQGAGDHTVRPSVFCPGPQVGVFFDGAVPDGETLVIDSFDGATLGNDPVDDKVRFFSGAIYDFSREGGSFSQEAGSLQVAAGTSEWRFKVATAVCDGADYDLCVFETPDAPICTWDGDFHFDQCVFEYAPAGISGMAWDERVACSFKLLLPSHVPTRKETAGTSTVGASPVTRISSIIQRFKPAGIHAFVDSAKEAWILGSSVLRDDSAADGEGVEFHSMRLINPRTELFVP